MPTYEYKCEACGHAFEKFQSIMAAPIKKCPKCGKSKVRRLIGTGAGLIFKGSGFYITDYRSDGYKSEAKSDSSSTSEKSSSETKAADSKPAETKAESSSKPVESTSKSEIPAPKSESKPAAKSFSKKK